MPWCDLFEAEGAPAPLKLALRDLNVRVQAALTNVGHKPGFLFGRLPGTPVEHLYSALNVELSFTDAWLHGRPRLERVSENRLRYNAPPTRSIGRSHRDYQLASDLLRALAWEAYRPLVHDQNLRNTLCRNFADGWLFGDPAHFAERLDKYGSIFDIHREWDVPVSAMAAYTAKFRLDAASVDTLVLLGEPHAEYGKAWHRHRLGIQTPPEDRLAHARQLLRSAGGGPVPGARSMQFAARTASGGVLLVNASAGMVKPMGKDGNRWTDEVSAVRMIFASVPRLPTSMRGVLH
jgi:hypothetical protein